MEIFYARMRLSSSRSSRRLREPACVKDKEFMVGPIGLFTRCLAPLTAANCGRSDAVVAHGCLWTGQSGAFFICKLDG